MRDKCVVSSSSRRIDILELTIYDGNQERNNAVLVDKRSRVGMPWYEAKKMAYERVRSIETLM